MGDRMRIYYNAIFGAISGLIGWLVIGSFTQMMEYHIMVRDMLSGAIVGVLVGGLIGSIDGIISRAYIRAALGAIYGGLVGIFGGMVGLLLGEFASWLLKGGIFGRAFGWMFFGLFIGLSEGMVNRSPKKSSYGAIGGTVGGFIGGLIFESTRSSFGDYQIGQIAGLIILGACIGSFIALVEGILKTSWLKVTNGRLEGKEFHLTKSENIIGRDELCDIGLFGDVKIEKHHAKIVQEGKMFKVCDLGSGVLVNNVPVQEQILKDNDKIQVGDTSLLFREKS